MQAVRRSGTTPELDLRRALWACGLRYRVNAQLPGLSRRRADVLFTGPRVAVFVDGCFWHACPSHGTEPASNSVFWTEKLYANVKRDRETDRLLEEAGWVVFRVWEHDDPAAKAREIATVVRARGRRRRS